MYSLPNGAFIWIGDEQSLTPSFVEEIGVGYVLHFPKTLRSIPTHAAWLKNNGNSSESNPANDAASEITTKYLPLVTYGASLDDDETDQSWNSFKEISEQLLQFLDES